MQMSNILKGNRIDEKSIQNLDVIKKQRLEEIVRKLGNIKNDDVATYLLLLASMVGVSPDDADRMDLDNYLGFILSPTTLSVDESGDKVYFLQTPCGHVKKLFEIWKKFYKDKKKNDNVEVLSNLKFEGIIDIGEHTSKKDLENIGGDIYTAFAKRFLISKAHLAKEKLKNSGLYSKRGNTEISSRFLELKRAIGSPKFEKKAYEYVLESSVSLPNMKALLQGIRNFKEMDNLQKAVYILVYMVYEIREVTEGKSAIMKDMRKINDSIKIESGSAYVVDVSQTLDSLFKKFTLVEDGKSKEKLEKVAKDFSTSGKTLETLRKTIDKLFDSAKINSFAQQNRYDTNTVAMPTALKNRQGTSIKSPSEAPHVSSYQKPAAPQSPSKAPTSLNDRQKSSMKSPSEAPHVSSYQKPTAPQSPSKAPTSLNDRQKPLSPTPTSNLRSSGIRTRSASVPNTKPGTQQVNDWEKIARNITFRGVSSYDFKKSNASDVYSWLDTFLGVAQTKLTKQDDDMKYLAKKNQEIFGNNAFAYDGILVDLDKQKKVFSRLNKRLLTYYLTYKTKKGNQTLKSRDRFNYWSCVKSVVDALDTGIFRHIPKSNLSVKLLNFDVLKENVEKAVSENPVRRRTKSMFAMRAEKDRKNSGISSSDLLSEDQKNVIGEYCKAFEGYFNDASEAVKEVGTWVDFNNKLNGTDMVLKKVEKYLNILRKLANKKETLLGCKAYINRALDGVFAGIGSEKRSLDRFDLVPTILGQKVMRLPMICKDLFDRVKDIEKQVELLEKEPNYNLDSDINIHNNRIFIKKNAKLENNLKSKCDVFYKAVAEGDVPETIGKLKPDKDIDGLFEICKSIREGEQDVIMDKSVFMRLTEAVEDKFKKYCDKLERLSRKCDQNSPFGGNKLQDGEVIEQPASLPIENMKEFIKQLVRIR